MGRRSCSINPLRASSDHLPPTSTTGTGTTPHVLKLGSLLPEPSWSQRNTFIGNIASQRVGASPLATTSNASQQILCHSPRPTHVHPARTHNERKRQSKAAEVGSKRVTKMGHVVKDSPGRQASVLLQGTRTVIRRINARMESRIAAIHPHQPLQLSLDFVTLLPQEAVQQYFGQHEEELPSTLLFDFPSALNDLFMQPSAHF